MTVEEYGITTEVVADLGDLRAEVVCRWRPQEWAYRVVAAGGAVLEAEHAHSCWEAQRGAEDALRRQAGGGRR